MKRSNNLYDKVCELDNIRLAHKNASRRKSKYSEVKKINEDPEFYLSQLSILLKKKKFKNSQYTIFERKCGNKIREIHKLPYYPDRIVHHAIMNILEPIWRKTFINHTYSSIKGRGIHRAVVKLKHILKDDKINTKYCLKLDIQKFYPSINNGILKGIIRMKIKCRRTLELLDEIIDSSKGIPIGNYLSQYFGNLYLTYFDHYCKEELRCKYYFRYCDDIVILDGDKKFLHDCFNKINDYLKNELNLSVKNNWQVFPVEDRGIDFLGYKFYTSHTLLRNGIAKRYMRISNINSLPSFEGWLLFADCNNLKNKKEYGTI